MGFCRGSCPSCSHWIGGLVKNIRLLGKVISTVTTFDQSDLNHLALTIGKLTMVFGGMKWTAILI